MTEWLKKEVSWIGTLEEGIFFFLLQVSYCLTIYTMSTILGGSFIPDGFIHHVMVSDKWQWELLKGVLVDKVLFIGLLIGLPVSLEWPMWVIYTIASASACLYGGMYMGTTDTVLQIGISFLLSLQFLKSGAFQGRYIRALFACVYTTITLDTLKIAVFKYIYGL